jgi:hypothetical protein
VHLSIEPKIALWIITGLSNPDLSFYGNANNYSSVNSSVLILSFSTSSSFSLPSTV